MYLFDTHCHIDLQKDPLAVVQRTEAAKIYTFAVTNAPSVFKATAKLVEATKYLRPALGLHPELVATHDHELPILERYFPLTRYIGEVGLDYTTSDMNLRQRQRVVFSRVLELASEYNDRIITIHSRRAAADVIAMIDKNLPAQVILHWFSGTTKQLEQAIERRFWFSVNPAMMRSQHSIELIRMIPKTQVLLETDGPFVEIERRDAEPTDVGLLVPELASIWAILNHEVQEILWQNFSRMLKAGISTAGVSISRRNNP